MRKSKSQATKKIFTDLYINIKIYNSLVKNKYQQNNIKFMSYAVKRKYGTAFYDKNGFDRYELNKAEEILTGVEHYLYDYPVVENGPSVIEFLKGSKRFLDEKIFSLMGKGRFSFALDIGNGRVLKISSQNPFEYRKHNSRFDIPLLSEIYRYGNMYGYIQAKADKRVTPWDVFWVKIKICGIFKKFFTKIHKYSQI